MPISLLIALVIAFGFESARGGVPSSDVRTCLLETLAGVSFVTALAIGLGWWVARRVAHTGYAPGRLRRRYLLGARVMTLVSLVVFAWVIHGAGWSRLVRANWALGDLVLVDDLLVFLPFALIQLGVWSGAYLAERALHITRVQHPSGGFGRYLILRTRQSVGLILPVVLLYVIRREVLTRYWPQWEDDPMAEPLEVAVLGTIVLLISPLFVRLALPTSSLPVGPLRRRLERIADRAGFRFADILVWDTGSMAVNACVTGILPGFRYVLLSDALIDSLSPLETAAVFGHEIGHIAHRHLLYFAFFFLGSLGVLSLAGDLVATADPWVIQLAAWTPLQPAILREVIEGALLLAAVGVYFWLIFGQISRRFEREADVFGGKVVSCGLADCPPHDDADSDEPTFPVSQGISPVLCPVGIRIFADALANVARLNGLDPHGRSWRHGSIAYRIAFLRGLERHPERERTFRRGVGRLRMALLIVLSLALAAAFVTRGWAFPH